MSETATTVTPMLDPFEEGWADGWEIDQLLSLCDWADKHVILGSKDSAEPGPYRTSRTPYVREIAECLSPYSPIETVVWQAGSQVGKTRVGLNWVGYVIDVSPGPMLMVEPTVDTAKRVSKQRVAPMIEAVEVLKAKVSPARERDSSNTMLEKEFPGGIFLMTGANSAVGLRSMPIRFLILDETDGYPQDVDGEGDPSDLAEERTATFARRKILKTSTPTIKGLSRIESDYHKSDQRRYFVPCPFCGFFDWIRWENITWPDGQPELARLRCISCNELIDERYKTQMLDQGQWRPTSKEKGDPKVAGFHLSALYSPVGWRSWTEIVKSFVEARHDPKKLQVWVNTELGETWEERGDSVQGDDLKARLENYAAEVPNGVATLVASVDVQGDRLECAVKGYGEREESWLIALEQIQGDPAKETTWFELDRFLGNRYTHESGRQLIVEIVAVDSGGLHTDHVYRYCKTRAARRVVGGLQHIYPIKGVGGAGKEILGRPKTSNRYRVKLYPVGVDTVKDTIFSRMHIPSPGPGYLHLPAWVDDEYLAQLTAEKAVRKYKKHVGSVREYVKLRERNEGLDLEVYALAALYMHGRQFVANLGRRARELAAPNRRPDDPTTPTDQPPTPSKPTRRRKGSGSWSGVGGRGWVKGWK